MSGNLLSTMHGVEKLRTSNRYPQDLITETFTNGFLTVDKEWIVQHWNKAASVLLKIDSKDVIGKNLWEVFGGTIPLIFFDVYAKAFHDNSPFRFVEYWPEMDSWFDVVTYNSNETMSVSFKSSNHPVRFEQSNHPSKQLKVLIELYRFVTEITNDCLWEWDLENEEMFWIDGGHKKALGYPIENALIPQIFWENCLHPDDRPRILAKLNHISTIGDTEIWEDEYRFKKSDGTYAYISDRGYIIYNNEKKACRMIGAALDITEKVMLTRKLDREIKTRQREVTEAVIEAQELERLEIGKELHDNLNQVLGAAKLHIEMAKSDNHHNNVHLDKASSYILQVIEEIRQISKNLSPPGVDGLELSDSVRMLMDDLTTIHPIKIEFYQEGLEGYLIDKKLQLNIFRIIQEQLTNILKHAQARRVTIHLGKYENEIVLLISDNGNGCTLQERNKGVGFTNIRSRAELLHGVVTLDSKPGRGFSLKLNVPLVKNGDAASTNITT